MSPEEEFHDESDVRRYFLRVLPLEREPSGRYNFRESGLRAMPGSLILCQFQSGIRAQSILKERVNKELVRDGVRYRGFLRLDTASIRYFSRPISEAEVQTVWPEFRFSNARWDLAIDGFERWDALTRRVGFETVDRPPRL